MKSIVMCCGTYPDAHRACRELYRIIKNSTPIDVKMSDPNCIVKTKNVSVRFVSRETHLEGIRCDIPCGFDEKIARRMTHGAEYEKMTGIKDIAKYIVEEEMK